ncbi:MAG: hypothetical protein K8R59_03875 [Thermoanaerobaculales bacterium]|nr:hypothetical protein [Thermoanaerobaculales bacterium]
MLRRVLFLYLIAIVPMSGVVVAQAPPPIGDDFMVQSTADALGNSALVASSAGGGFFVAWFSGEITGRMFTALGTPLGDEFEVNSTTAGTQSLTGIGMNPGGAAIVAFNSSSPWPGGARIRRFDAFGNPLGNDFPITTADDGTTYPVVDLADSGAFVVAFRKGVIEGQGTEILVRRYDANASPLGPEAVINTYTDDWQDAPAIAVAPNGAFVVAWASEGSPGADNDDYSIQARCFTADGIALGDQFQVNTTAFGDQAWPDVGIADSGAFVIVWDSDSSSGSDNDNSSVQAQRFTANCLPVGSEFQLNTYISGWQGDASVAVSPNGAFVVVWDSAGSPATDNDGTSTQARSYTADGIPMSNQYQVNTTEEGYQRMSAVAGNPASRFVTVWDHYIDGVEWTVRARLFGYPTVFLDGFETGNALQWSSTFP